MDNIQRNISSRNIMWYRDGSKTQDTTRAGTFGPGNKYSEMMGRLPSIFHEEVHTIDVCAREKMDTGYNGQNMAITSDSQAAVQALSSPVVRSRMI